MNINNLPDITFCETDASAIETSVITTYETISGQLLAPGDPVRLFLESLAYLIIQQRLAIDQTGKMNLLRYATGDYLDHLGALVGTQRLQASAASATIRFTLDTPLTWAVTIPVGTRVTPDAKTIFATAAVAEIPIGDTYIDVTAVCATTGADGNGYIAGQINRLVDLVAYITAVVNTTTSLGGADIESDTNFRQRIQIAPESFSVAGPSGAYIYWAKTASQDIIDVAVYSPAPGIVRVYPLVTGGNLPGVEILAAVDAILSDEKVRPLCDSIFVLSPEDVAYDIIFSYYISRPDAAMATQIQVAVDQAVERFSKWQQSKLGRDINPSKLIADIQAAGAKRVEIVSPVFMPLDVWQVAQLGTVAVTYGGLENE